MSSIVAIVGRPNVGKSSLFNLLTGSRAALVADFSGLTRDRQYGGDSMSSAILIDTGGLGSNSSDLSKDVIKQTNLAIDEADFLFFLVDGKDGLVPLDEEIAKKLRKTNKPVKLIVNKIDNAKDFESSTEFDQLGFQDKVIISAAHNKGLGKITFDLGGYYLIDKVKTNINGSVTNGNYVKIYIDDALVAEGKSSSGTKLWDITNTIGKTISYETISKAHNDAGQIATWSGLKDFQVFGNYDKIKN